MTAPFFFGSPAQEREARRHLQWAGHPRSWELEEQRARVEQEMERFRARVAEHRAQWDAEELARIDAFRKTLPPHRLGWFDGLSIEDQKRLSRPRVTLDQEQIEFDREAKRNGWWLDPNLNGRQEGMP